jgi:hypothetical protein
VGSLTANPTRPRRQRWYELELGSEAAAADNPFLWQVQRCTTAGTAGSSVTPQPLDPADAATEAVGGQAHSVNPTQTASAYLLTVPLNQRATFRWVAVPGKELVTPATASNGAVIITPTSSAVAVTALLHADEQ